MNAELRINTELRIEIPLNAEYWNKLSTSCGIPQSRSGKAFQYSVSTRNSALKFPLMRSIGTNFPLHAESRSPDVEKCSNTPYQRELHIEIPLDAEYWNKFSASCGIPLFVNISGIVVE